jgi:tRNA 2-thiouridine synthesizing protein A
MKGEIVMREIDCRDMGCPQPVINTKKALEEMEEGVVTVIVDNPAARDNVRRFAESQGCSVEVERKGQDFYIHIQKVKGEGKEKMVEQGEKVKKIVVYINSDLLGVGDEALGSFLMKAFLKTLLDLEEKPNRLILINSGVQLASEGSEVLETLIKLSEAGTEILSCGTCLDFYKLREKMSVGKISNMYDIIQSVMEADILIRP